ncbi:MAG: hypothetical protein MRY83_01345 [Flavobacteriales bacterium]|nr:hypothetical protein [Flavobacteriales bacterium]
MQSTRLFLSWTIYLVLSIVLQSDTFGQNCPCCDDFHKQFDFWLGDWTVYDTADNKVGENTIIKLENSCLLKENWKGSSGGTGTSFNYFDKTDSTWNQTWVDGSGNVLKLKGNLIEGKMVLKSELTPGQKVALYYNQVTWTPGSDGSVQQLWQTFDEKHNLLGTAFLGVYRKNRIE